MKFRKCYVLREVEIPMCDLKRGDVFRLGKADSDDQVESGYSVATGDAFPEKPIGNIGVQTLPVEYMCLERPIGDPKARFEMEQELQEQVAQRLANPTLTLTPKGTPMSDHIKPCPFCDDPRVIVVSMPGPGCAVAVQCQVCGAIGPQTNQRKSAIHYWNERAKEGIEVQNSIVLGKTEVTEKDSPT